MVYAHRQPRPSDEVAELRKQGGRLIRSLREAQGVTQVELAQRVAAGFPHTFVYEIERGTKRIPPDRFEDWAEALGVTPLWLVQNLMPFYDPITYEILYGSDAG